jgi:hypothetical protein
LPAATEFIPASCVSQVNSRLHSAKRRATELITVDHLNDGFPYTSHLTAGFLLSRERPLLAVCSKVFNPKKLPLFKL